ncbi:MAG: YceI family protein [Ferruginibacter sp.]
MKKSIILFATIGLTTIAFAQKKQTTTSATINFDATTSTDALPKAENKTVIASLDSKTGNVAFESVIKSFTFGNPRMQEHFNGEKWMDSDKFPTATFTGKITNLAAVNFKKDGTYSATVTGELTMQGVTKPVTTTSSVVVAGKTINTTTDFTVKLSDYGVNGSAIAAGKVATEPKISVVAEFK